VVLELAMSTVVFPAVIEEAGEDFSVYFPDVPGCTSAGRTVEHAMLNAENALEAYLLALAGRIDHLPTATPIAQLADKVGEGVVGVFLARAEAPGRAVRINITIDEGLLAQIDRVASNRSGFLADAAREALARNRSAAT
jgi:predicted RNase H-like HicB family nuclease